MPRKLDRDATYGQKLIRLFVLLLFSGESYSLTELSQRLGCSKATVLRLIDDITNSYAVAIEDEWQGNRRFVRIARGRVKRPPAPVTEMELTVLEMCRTFAERLLGREQFEEATRALLKTRDFLPDGSARNSGRHFASFLPGSIDYTPHQENLRLLMEAMYRKRVCKVVYHKPMAERSKAFHIKPLKIFSCRDTVYLHARRTVGPGEKYEAPHFDPLLAVHRIRKVELTQGIFEFPKDYDFEKFFNQEFGVIKGDPFEVEIEVSGWAAQHVAERIWSAGQRVQRKKGGRIALTFRAGSEPELLSWVLSFGSEARVIAPDWLVVRIRETANGILETYGRPAPPAGT